MAGTGDVAVSRSGSGYIEPMIHGPTPSDPNRTHNATAPLSIQERLYPALTCFGCGHANPDGLQLRSFAGVDEVTATFMPWPQHDNGFGFLNGGIIGTLLDCHSAAAVMLGAEARGWVAEGSGLAYVTAGLHTRYLRPSPLREPVILRAVIERAEESQMVVEAELHWDGKVRATATATWKRWRPRPA